MRLQIKQFKSKQRVDVCDDFGNVLWRVHYEGQVIDIGTVIRINAWVQGYREGWDAARNSIRGIVADGQMIDVDALNANNWKETA
jgi:hypothetical protein